MYTEEKKYRMSIVALANRKGGVGKSTLAVNLAACLVESGSRVLVCDLDPQAAATVHLGIDYSKSGTLVDVLSGGAELAEVVVHTKFGIHVTPASPFLVGTETALIHEPGRETILRQALTPILAQYDWMLVDTPPSLGILTLNALTASEYVLIPAIAEFASVEAVAQTLETVRVIQRRLNNGLHVLGVVANRVEARIRSVGEVCRRFEELGCPVLSSRVRKSVRLADAFGFQEPITTFDPHHPVCSDIRALAEEVRNLVAARSE